MKKYLLLVPFIAFIFFQTSYAQAPTSPILEQPPDLDRVVLPTVTFRWQDLTGVLGYSIEIANDPLFFTDIGPLISSPTSSYTVPSGMLSSNTLYYWRVRGDYASGSGPFSGTFSFSTAGTPSQETDYLKNIINNLESNNAIPLFQGNLLINRLNQAEIQIAANNDFYAIVDFGIFEFRVFMLRISGLIAPSDAQYLNNYADKIIQLIYNGNSKLAQNPPALNTIPKEYSLGQNYPNPFNPTTNIEYSIPKNANVTLKVYDILGKEVATLVNKQQDAGSYIAVWNASNFSSGIYFYRLTAGSFVQTKRMSLTK